MLAAESGGGFELPPIDHLFVFPAWFDDGLFGEGSILAFNRTSFLYLLAALITIGLVVAAFGNPKVVPGKLQAGMEAGVDFVKNSIIGAIIGPEGYRYLPLLFSLFIFIFVNNLFEVLPFINFPPTSRMALPAVLSLMIYFLFIFVGIKAQGPKYFWNAVSVPGVPKAMLLLIVPIEFVSTFLLRPFTLAVRLFANMMAGHILLTVVFLASNYSLVDFHSLYEGGVPEIAAHGWIQFALGIPIFVGAIALVGFEILVGSLQAYIFTMLAAVYISGSLSPDH
nr:F0F1 ATP synthase subunit A [Salsipaludibacter albus]